MSAYSQQEINRHIVFWTRQFAEHAEFLAADVRDPKLARPLLSNAKRWYQLFSVLVSNERNKLAHSILQEHDYSKLGELLQQLTDLQHNILVELQDNVPLGIPIALVTHMLEEQEYFWEFLMGKMSPGKELKFWSKESEEHTRLLGQMVDPTDARHVALSDKILKLAASIKQAKGNDQIALMNESTKGAQNAVKSVEERKLHLLIPIKMVLHEIREAQQAQHRIDVLQYARGKSGRTRVSQSSRML